MNKRRKNRLTCSKLVSLFMGLVIAVSFTSFSAFAKGASGGETLYLENENGTKTLISEQEYKNLKQYGELSLDGQEKDGLNEKTLPKESPNYNGVFEVYSDYFKYYPYNISYDNTGGMSLWGSYKKLYLEYSTDGVNWTKNGYMSKNFIKLGTEQDYVYEGLSPNTTYYTRIHYQDDPAYLNTTTIRTGIRTMPPVKSVTVKAVNIRHRKVRHYLYGIYLYTEKFYTYKIKVTIKLRKAPGIQKGGGLMIRVIDSIGWDTGAVCLPGNKRTYTKTFNPYPNYSASNPKGKKRVAIGIRSYQSKIYGGVSPMWERTKKVT